jgi:hypothetical protein
MLSGSEPVERCGSGCHERRPRTAIHPIGKQQAFRIGLIPLVYAGEEDTTMLSLVS